MRSRSKSNRVTSSMKHKIIRKKRENKRDLRKAAKAMKKGGLKTRSKKSREEAKLALKISNANPDKAEMLQKLLTSREESRVLRGNRRQQKREDALRQMAADATAEEVEEGEEEEDEEDDEEGWEEVDSDDEELPNLPTATATKARLVFPHNVGSNFKVQFPTFVDNFVYDTDSAGCALPSAIIVTVDVRCGVQSLPFAILDHIVEAALEAEKNKKNNSVLLLITATKVDLVSSQALGTAMALISEAIYRRYAKLPKSLKVAFAPFSYDYEKTARHVLAILRNFATHIHGDSTLESTKAVDSNGSNMKDKLAVAILGFPNTGRHTLGRTLVEVGSDSAVSVTPARTLQFVTVPVEKSSENDAKKKRKETEEEEEEEKRKIIVPNAKQITLLTFPDDTELAKRMKVVTSGDICLHSYSFIEKLAEPEAVAALLADAVIDKVSLCQTFSLPMVFRDDDEGSGAMTFLKRLGANLRRDKGFVFASPLLAGAGTAGQVTASNLTASTAFAARQDSSRPAMISAYSGAVPGKVVRVAWSRGDNKNALRLGARAFLKEWHAGRHIPWAVMRPVADEKEKKYVAAVEAQKRCIFSTDFLPAKSIVGAAEASAATNENFNKNVAAMTYVIRDYLALLPHAVVELAPDAIVPEQHDILEE